METIEEKTRELVDKYTLQEWFLGKPSGNRYALDIIKYLDLHVSKDAAILEMGCGIGQNLVELWRHGFYNLCGIERDEKTFYACQELINYFEIDALVENHDACEGSAWGDFDVIMPLNFTYQKDVNLPELLVKIRSMLMSKGLLVIDIISSKLDKNKAPEYHHRFSEQEFFATAKDFEFKEAYDYFPRTVYFMEAV